jgi:hypothetical protein
MISVEITPFWGIKGKEDIRELQIPQITEL